MQKLTGIAIQALASQRWRVYREYRDSGIEWLGMVPKHWKLRKLKRLVKKMIAGPFGSSLTKDMYTKEGYKVYGQEQVIPANFFIGDYFIPEEIYQAMSQYAIVPGDILISCVGTFGKIAVVPSDAMPGIINPRLAKLFPDTEIITSAYLGLLLKSQIAFEQMERLSRGGTMGVLNLGLLSHLILPLPPLVEQQAIVTFLDHQTARIDALIAKKEQHIALLQEKRAALISHAVTKGLNDEVPTKDSGVEWLGMVPEHWSVRRVKYLSSILRGKFSHRPRNDPRLYDGSYPFIQTGDITAADKYITSYQQTLNELGFNVSKRFPSGTLVMAIAANIGDLAILQFEACFPDSIVGFVPKPGILLEFLYYNLIAMKQEFMGASTINTQSNINIDQIGTLFTVCPPVFEQEKIITYLNQQTAKIDSLISAITDGIKKLQEYRTALISAAVTGKIDVRGTMAEEPGVIEGAAD